MVLLILSSCGGTARRRICISFGRSRNEGKRRDLIAMPSQPDKAIPSALEYMVCCELT